ncbi:MAG: ASKHA domain-containing protein [Eubacteriales bacterium]
MNIHTSSQVCSLAPDPAKTLLELAATLPGAAVSTPCGGHGKCGKCVCAVRYSSDESNSGGGGGGNGPAISDAEAAFLKSVKRDDVLRRCRVPAEERGSVHVRFLCLCPADGISDVYLPVPETLRGAVFGEAIDAESPVVTAQRVTLTAPTIQNPVDTEENLRAALGGGVLLPPAVLCRTSAYLRDGVTDLTVYTAGAHAIDVTSGAPDETLAAVLAVDVGTTTVALSLRDRSTGRELCGDVFANPQRSCGGDVISRMSRAAAGDGPALTRSIRDAVAEHVTALCRRAGIDKNQILYTALAGNSVMEHLYAGLDTAPIAVAPFFLQTRLGWEVRASDPLCGADAFMAPDGRFFFAPLAASYVGGDITVGMAYLLRKYPDLRQKNALFLDLGTNGELCVVSGGTFYFAATAAGPALEGAEITMGMSASAGAIYKVRAENGRFQVNVVGSTEENPCPAAGICGSGIIDATAEAVRTGLIAPTGSICDDFDELEDDALLFGDESAPPRTYDRAVYDALYQACVDEDEGCLCLTDTVKLTGADIRAVQTAKAAIAAGITVLLRTAGLTAEELDAVYLAGSFGGGIDVRSAAEIGLIPRTCAERGIVEAVGNTSLAGAAAYLFDETVRENLRELPSRARYVELSSDKDFTDAFVKAMMF